MMLALRASQASWASWKKSLFFTSQIASLMLNFSTIWLVGRCEPGFRLLQGLIWIPQWKTVEGLDTWKTAASFGHLHERLLQGLYTWKTAALGVEAWSTPSVGPRIGNRSTNAHQQRVASQQPRVGILRCWQQQLSTKYQIYCCVHSSVSSVAPHWVTVLQASTPKAEVFQIVQ